LGTHYCEPYLSIIPAYPENIQSCVFNGYYDAIFVPFMPYVLAGLEKIKVSN
jgi:hypothetical protein